MILERSDVQFPLWRKKVDRSLLQQGVTPLPLWVCRMWGIQEDFQGIASRSKSESHVSVRLAGVQGLQEGWVTCLTKGRGTALFRLFLDEPTKRWLRRAYPMTHLRAIETVLEGNADQTIDAGIPFWEFLDIEYNRRDKQFLLTDYYKQTPPFPRALGRVLADTVLDGLTGAPSAHEVAAST